jgi:hypothetical protein
MNNTIKDPCVLCRESIKGKAIGFWTGGNNAEPLATGQCCDDCNASVVYERLSQVLLSSKSEWKR